jgi:hypothetical protein
MAICVSRRKKSLVGNMAGTSPQAGIVENAIALLAKSPQFIFLLAAARLSGQGWLYIIVTCNDIPAARLKFLNNHSGITILGLLSFVPAMILLHWAINGFKRFEMNRP